jgi:hypothetical protein
MQTVPTIHPVSVNGFHLQSSARNTPPTGDLEAARIARKLKTAGWLALNLRQTFTDETFMRNHLKAAGLRAPDRMEPATVSRLRTLLKRAKIAGPEITDSVGTSLCGFLALNPMLPLWAAVALVLESTGRFTHQAIELARLEAA